MSRAVMPLAQARRIALGAQGLHRRRPSGGIGLRRLRSTLERLAVLQIDSVNVLTRAHHLPFFARLGAYDRDRLDRLLWRDSHRDVFEYHAHEAAVVAHEIQPLLRHRMEWFRQRYPLDPETAAYVAEVYREIEERGALAATDLSDGGTRTGPWWGLSRGKRALRYLYRTGQLALATRRTNFEVVYDLPERVLPAEVLARPTPSTEEAHRRLLRIAAQAHGIGTATDLADYFRLKNAPARTILNQLVAEGELESVVVAGWDEPAYLHPEAVIPRTATGAALLSPFDPLVWFRPRIERLWDYHYRIEIYVPEAQRQYGYYVLPFLLGDRLVARVDLKADRHERVLRVRGAFSEKGETPTRVAEALAEELHLMAAWLDLDEVAVEDRGDLARTLGLSVVYSR